MKAAPGNVDALADLIQDLTVIEHGGESGYSESADAMWKAALAAFNYTAREVGATGFQASWSALRFYGEAMNVEGPFMIIQVHDALYPQYDIPGRVAGFLDEQRDWLREQAKAKLAERDDHSLVHPDVLAHWRKLAAS